ncbi:MAG TPA: sigma-70 family RNA polymerase sigma factor [Candidatus Limnocylindrales bacterium]|nr:sigma-70 family RNA polymerase sigma factor [Candidatus Limnocylindrales bacterium]
MDDATIDRLVAQARQGDLQAFGTIFDHYHAAVYRFVVSRVGRPSDAEDLTQLVFVKALEALPRYTARGVPFGGWLFRLARNTVIDHVRTRREHVELEVVTRRATEEAGPEAVAALRDDLDAVARALEELTEDQREVIALRFFAGLSAREAAEAMGRQEGTIRGLQFRAIGALRRSLGIEVIGASMGEASGSEPREDRGEEPVRAPFRAQA